MTSDTLTFLVPWVKREAMGEAAHAEFVYTIRIDWYAVYNVNKSTHNSKYQPLTFQSAKSNKFEIKKKKKKISSKLTARMN